ncbi:hypothetical protein ES708_23617 [subsurface metagenome]
MLHQKGSAKAAALSRQNWIKAQFSNSLPTATSLSEASTSSAGAGLPLGASWATRAFRPSSASRFSMKAGRFLGLAIDSTPMAS